MSKQNMFFKQLYQTCEAFYMKSTKA